MLTIYQVTLDNLINIDDIYLDPTERAASLCFSRMERFIDGYYVRTELIKLCNEFFSDRGVIQSAGLSHQYKTMKDKVINENLIGLILCGLHMKDTLISNYTTYNHIQIPLTVSSITRILIREYFSKFELDNLCRLTHNFEIYYNPTIV
jgi:hypothetical protein